MPRYVWAWGVFSNKQKLYTETEDYFNQLKVKRISVRDICRVYNDYDKPLGIE